MALDTQTLNYLDINATVCKKKNMPSEERHPVWDLYDKFRTMKLNVKYYTEKQRRAKSLNSKSELVLAIFSSSAVTAWLYADWGLIVWKICGSCATILAVCRYVTKPSETIRKIENRVTFYDTACSDLEKLCREVRTVGNYSNAIRAKFETIISRIDTFRVSYIDSDKDPKLNRKCSEEVRTECPTESFFVPGGNHE